MAICYLQDKKKKSMKFYQLLLILINIFFHFLNFSCFLQ